MKEVTVLLIALDCAMQITKRVGRFHEGRKALRHWFDLCRLFHLHACWKQEVCTNKE